MEKRQLCETVVTNIQAAAYTLALPGMKINSRIIPLSFRPHCPPRFWYPLLGIVLWIALMRSSLSITPPPSRGETISKPLFSAFAFSSLCIDLPYTYIYIYTPVYVCMCGVVMRPQPLLQGPGDSRSLLAENGSKGPSLHRSLLVISTARSGVVGQRGEEEGGLRTKRFTNRRRESKNRDGALNGGLWITGSCLFCIDS